MKVKGLSVFFLIFALSAVAACSTSNDPYPIDNIIFDSLSISSIVNSDDMKAVVSKKNSDTCNISVYLDATKSMQGFVGGEVPGNFENVLQSLEDTAFISFSNSSFSYFRFWENPEAIEREVFRKEAFSPEFYKTSQAGDDNDATQTNLLNVLNSIGTSMKDPAKDMAIIATDLVSTSQSDRSDIARCIDEQYIQKGYSVALLGIQGSYSGRVYDIVANGESHSYMYTGNRPYYLVIIGGTANVESFISQLENRTLSTLPEGEYEKIIISPQTLDVSEPLKECPLGIMSEDENYEVYINPISKDIFVSSQYQSQLATANAEYVQIFYDITTELKDKDKPGVSIQWNNPYISFADSTVSLNPNGWSYNAALAEIQGLPIDQETGVLLNEVDMASIEANTSPANILCEDSIVNGSQITVPLKILLQKTTKDQTYLVRIDLYGTPSFETKTYPDWINSWSMDFTNLDSWSSDSATFPGTTTPYLNELLSTIWDKCATESAVPEKLYIGSYFLGFVACEPTDDTYTEACLEAIDSEKALVPEETSVSETEMEG